MSSSSSLIQCMDLLGFYGFVVIIVVVCIHIHTRVWESTCFLVGIWVSFAVNKWLKSVIRDPRPTHPVPFQFRFGDGEGQVMTEKVRAAHLYQGAELYGYPSGHAQHAFYALSFFALVLWHRPNVGWWYVWVMCVFVACVSLFQRWKYRRHTVEQLGAGTVVGMLFGWGVFSSVSVVRNWVRGQNAFNWVLLR